jgi:hypothetical protein
LIEIYFFKRCAGVILNKVKEICFMKGNLFFPLIAAAMSGMKLGMLGGYHQAQEYLFLPIAKNNPKIPVF